MSDLRLFDHVIRSTQFRGTAAHFARMTEGEVVVDATNVARWVDANVVRDASVPIKETLKVVTRCVPPFEATFVEWRAGGSQMGAHIWRAEKADGSEGYEVFGNAWERTGGELIPLPLVLILQVDKDGVPDWDTFRAPYFDEVDKPTDEEFFATVGETKEKLFLAPAFSIFFVALVAFRFSHARNVELVEHGPTRAIRRLAERTGTYTPVRYYTLDIEPITKALAAEGNVASEGIEKALHICRGHFKDYTQGRGLFGKYRVEVFVPEHLKGHASKGTIVKDYRVLPPVTQNPVMRDK